MKKTWEVVKESGMASYAMRANHAYHDVMLARDALAESIQSGGQSGSGLEKSGGGGDDATTRRRFQDQNEVATRRTWRERRGAVISHMGLGSVLAQ